MEDDMFRIAAILDPRFRMTWASASDVSSLTDILVTEGLRFQEIDEVQSPSSKVLKLEEDSIFSFLTPTKRRHRSGADPISLEVKAYLNEDNEHLSVNPIDYWKNSESDYPILAKMAKHYLAILASSVPVERLFSVAEASLSN
ncbi:uncharacterized protein LOC132757121 [Ruditapes philippinarum]|uniref:uncharacterized protein LOC132757121 n=1 Tax=Ruditapes philippinarum TaxID=129788 RepID=UPI00295AA0C9|nr:uncharacterized protein LOC132757121 [Ruditapes philippinarum]